MVGRSTVTQNTRFYFTFFFTVYCLVLKMFLPRKESIDLKFKYSKYIFTPVISLFIFITRLNIASYVTDPFLVLPIPRMRWSTLQCVTPSPTSFCIEQTNKQTLGVYQMNIKIYCMYILYFSFYARDQYKYMGRKIKDERCFSKVTSNFLSPTSRALAEVRDVISGFIHVNYYVTSILVFI